MLTNIYSITQVLPAKFYQKQRQETGRACQINWFDEFDIKYKFLPFDVLKLSFIVVGFPSWIHDYQDACVDKIERFIRGDRQANEKVSWMYDYFFQTSFIGILEYS